MMKKTNPVAYEALKSDLPELTEKKNALVNDIWGVLVKQTEHVRREHPFLAPGGRPIHIFEEQPGQTSVENYQKGELLTFLE